MSWLRFGDEWIDSESIAGLSDGAVVLHIAALTYCTRHDTDGHLSSGAARRLPRWAARRVRELVAAQLWEEYDDGGCLLADYADHCRTLADKAADAERMRIARKQRRASETYGANDA